MAPHFPQRLKFHRLPQATTKRDGLEINQRIRNTTSNERNKMLEQLRLLGAQEERLAAQLKLARKNYAELLESRQTLQANMREGANSGVIWFAEPATVEDPLDHMEHHTSIAMLALYIGLLIGFMITVLHVLTDKSLVEDEDIMMLTSLRILGRVPALGPITFDNGQVRINIKQEGGL